MIMLLLDRIITRRGGGVMRLAAILVCLSFYAISVYVLRSYKLQKNNYLTHNHL